MDAAANVDREIGPHHIGAPVNFFDKRCRLETSEHDKRFCSEIGRPYAHTPMTSGEGK